MEGALSSNVARIVGLLLFLLFCGHAGAQDEARAGDVNRDVTGQPAQVRQLLDLLADPTVQDWLRQRREMPAPTATIDARKSTSADLAARIADSRVHTREIILALQQLPVTIAEAGARLATAVHGDGATHGSGLAFLAFALGMAGVFGTHGWGRGATREWPQARPDTLGKLTRLGLRLLIATLPAVAFTGGVLIKLILFEWPPVLKNIVIAYALAVAAILLCYYGLRVLLVSPAPVWQQEGEKTADAEASIPVPANPDAATPDPDNRLLADTALARAIFYYCRSVLLIGYFVLAAATIETLHALEVPQTSVLACTYLLGVGLLGLALEVIWQRPAGDVAAREQPGTRAVNILLTVLGVVLWWLWAATFNGLFWLLTFAVMLPVTMRAVDWRIRRFMRPPSDIHAGHASVLEICLNRGARLALVIGAVYWLSEVWHLDLFALTDQTSPLKRLTWGILNAVITLFFADFLWQLAKAAIDTRLAQAGPPGLHGEDAPAAAAEADIGHHADAPVRQARLRTLRPTGYATASRRRGQVRARAARPASSPAKTAGEPNRCK